MTPTLSQLLSSRPKAVEAIRKSYGMNWLTDVFSENENAGTIRAYCASVDLGAPWLDSIETLLGLIESKAAEAPLSDAEIEGMRWRTYLGDMSGNGLRVFHVSEEGKLFEAASNSDRNAAIESHNADIDRCHREIKRMRKEPTNA